jgi:hypothetical protein
MKQGCEAFIMDWEEQLEKALLERETNAEVERKVCYEITEACVNVNVEDAPKMPEEIWVDGQPQPVGADGTANLGKGGDEGEAKQEDL